MSAVPVSPVRRPLSTLHAQRTDKATPDLADAGLVGRYVHSSLHRA